MTKTITIVTRYQVKVNGDLIDTKDSIDEAVKEITDRNYDSIDDEIMSREDVRRDDAFEGYDQAAYNRAWENLKADIANAVDTSYAYDDANGHEWSIKSVREVKDQIGCCAPIYWDIELDEDDWCYGEPVPTACGDYVLIRKLNDDGMADASIRVYEAMSLKDGHRDVIACDNATNWAVGSDDDAELNKSHFETLASHGVRWSEIEDSDLYDWIEARREEAEKKGVYVVEPCMIGDNATMEDANFIAEYLTNHGCNAVANDTEGHVNEQEDAPSEDLWDEACNACAVANNWN